MDPRNMHSQCLYYDGSFVRSKWFSLANIFCKLIKCIHNFSRIIQKDRRNKTNNGKASKYKKIEIFKENNGISTNYRIHFIIFISFEDLFGFFIFNLCRNKKRVRVNHFLLHWKRIFFYIFFFWIHFKKYANFLRKITRNVKTRAVISLFFVRYCVSYIFHALGVPFNVSYLSHILTDQQISWNENWTCQLVRIFSSDWTLNSHINIHFIHSPVEKLILYLSLSIPIMMIWVTFKRCRVIITWSVRKALRKCKC